jgi:5-methylcytosine-specific restriction endonuclease McrA
VAKKRGDGLTAGAASIPARIAALGFGDYREYLASPHWIEMQARVREERRCCEACTATNGLQVHHKTYKRLGRERLRDLTLLCGECHKWIHRNMNGSLRGRTDRLIRASNDVF